MLTDSPGGRLGLRLLLGPKTTVTPLHIDTSHNFLLQFVGAKKVAVFPSSQVDSLYIPWPNMPATGERYAIKDVFSPVDYEKPDVRHYPRYADTTPFEVVLEPGDMLYLPPRWAHYVRSLEDSITLSHWFMDYRMALTSIPKYLAFIARRTGERLGLVRGVSPA